jgi:hypothetical protein
MDNYVPAIKHIFNSKIFIMKKALFFLCVLFLSCKKIQIMYYWKYPIRTNGFLRLMLQQINMYTWRGQTI